MARLQTVKVMQRLSASLSGPSYTQCRRYGVAAPAHLDTTSPQRRGREKMSKAERRSLVESFVNKYKVMNAGKYPTPSHVTKAVGGSYYIVRKIVQELQHESQAQYEMAKKESVPLSSSLEDSCVQMPVCEEISVDTLIATSLGNEEDCTSKSLSYADDNSSKITDDDFKSLERDIEKEVEVIEIVDVNDEEVRSDTKLRGSAVSGNMASGLQEESKELSSSKDNGSSLNVSEKLADTKHVPGLDVAPKDHQEESTQVGKFTRNNEKDAEIEKYRDLKVAENDNISFAWKHMKSLADGILKIWRKF